MSRIVKAKYKIDRRIGANIRGTSKSAFTKRQTPPGQPPKKMSKLSHYGQNKRETKKIRWYYGALREMDLRKIYLQCKTLRKGALDENIMMRLEARLATFVYHAKWTNSIFGANQLVSHGKIKVNGKKVDIKSYTLKNGDIVELHQDMHSNVHVQDALKISKRVPDYVMMKDNFSGSFQDASFASVQYPVSMNYKSVIELYSR